MSIYIKRIVGIMDSLEQVHVKDSLDKVTSKNSSRFHEAIAEVYDDLGGTGDWKQIAPRDFDIELRNHAIVLDSDIDLNRYRTKTLRCEIYDKINLNAETLRRQNRTYEMECLKIASHGENWASGFAEQHFGKSTDNGVLTGDGSAQWKYIAFKNYLADLTPLINTEFTYHRISIYETLMINEKLTPLKTLLMSNREDYTTYLQKYFKRILKLDNNEK